MTVLIHYQMSPIWAFSMLRLKIVIVFRPASFLSVSVLLVEFRSIGSLQV